MLIVIVKKMEVAALSNTNFRAKKITGDKKRHYIKHRYPHAKE